jgi:membrane protein DedA with SNARE-associated domain
LRRVCSATERERATKVVRRWGLLAVVASRPVPLLAETVAVVAGAQRLGMLRTAAGAVVGALPGAVLYAAAGAAGSAGPSGLAALGVVLAVAALLWALGSARVGRTTPS